MPTEYYDYLENLCFSIIDDSTIAFSNAINNISVINIKNVIFNDPATIILWADGSKTVVKANGEPFDPEKGLAMAIIKKILGNKGNYYKIFKKYLPEEVKND